MAKDRFKCRTKVIYPNLRMRFHDNIVIGHLSLKFRDTPQPGGSPYGEAPDPAAGRLRNLDRPAEKSGKAGSLSHAAREPLTGQMPSAAV